jgi:hypothetical protein
VCVSVRVCMHLLLSCTVTTKLGNGILVLKWPDMNGEMAYRKIINCTRRTQLSNVRQCLGIANAYKEVFSDEVLTLRRLAGHRALLTSVMSLAATADSSGHSVAENYSAYPMTDVVFSTRRL